jgi:oligogalacturonide lyase
MLLLGANLLAQAGKDWGVEHRVYHDPVTNVRVTEITGTSAKSANLYYHFSNFTADDRDVIFTSNRGAGSQIFRYEVESGKLVQLTADPQTSASTACPDPVDADTIYYFRGPDLMKVSRAGESRRVATVPGISGGVHQPTLSGDRRHVTAAFQRDAQTWEIGLIELATGAYRTVIRQGFRIGHVQHSPTHPLIFYVWETGGYAPQRSWIVNTDGTANRPFYYRTDPKSWFTPLKEWATHEAWVAKTGQMTMILDRTGVILVDSSGESRMLKEGNFWHAAPSADGSRVVLDDVQGRLWLLETATGNLKLLVTGLRDSVRAVHAHASFNRAGNRILFNSGRTHETVGLISLE